MEKVKVKIKTNPYYVYFLDRTHDLLRLSRLFNKYNKILVITDNNVDRVCFPEFETELKKINSRFYKYVIKSGESSKSIKVATAIIDFLAENEFHRNDLVIALGGGVVGDLSGFVASTYMRGMDVIQVPTTLLAAVDASIGGKTAVDIKYGKNLMGTFHQPKAVIDILSIIYGLPNKIVLEGCSEIIKYGIIFDSTILEDFNNGLKSNLNSIIKKCVNAKATIVSEDEKESGLRKILNYGHTLAHSIEECSGHKISHGFAVAYGMLFANFVALKTGICGIETYSCLRSIVEKAYSLKKLDFSIDNLLFFMRKDKKNLDEDITLVLSDGHKNYLRQFKEDELRQLLTCFLKNE